MFVKHSQKLCLGVFVGRRNRYSVFFCRRGATEARDKSVREANQLKHEAEQAIHQQRLLQKSQGPALTAAPRLPVPPPVARVPFQTSPATYKVAFSDEEWVAAFITRGFSPPMAQQAVGDVKRILSTAGVGSFIAGSSAITVAGLSKRTKFGDIDIYVPKAANSIQQLNGLKNSGS
jgi:hypothetical protein